MIVRASKVFGLLATTLILTISVGTSAFAASESHSTSPLTVTCPPSGSCGGSQYFYNYYYSSSGTDIYGDEFSGSAILSPSSTVNYSFDFTQQVTWVNSSTVTIGPFSVSGGSSTDNLAGWGPYWADLASNSNTAIKIVPTSSSGANLMCQPIEGNPYSADPNFTTSGMNSNDPVEADQIVFADQTVCTDVLYSGGQSGGGETYNAYELY